MYNKEHNAKMKGREGVSITPIEILNKEFDKRFRGYDEEQVHDYLTVIVSELERLTRENTDLTQQLATSQEKLRYFEQLQDSLNNSIVVAHEAAERLKQNARKEAELILFEAEREADRLIIDANANVQRIITNNEELRRNGQQLQAQIRHMLSTQLDWLDNMEQFGIAFPSEQAKATPYTVAVEKTETTPVSHTETTEYTESSEEKPTFYYTDTETTVEEALAVPEENIVEEDVVSHDLHIEESVEEMNRTSCFEPLPVLEQEITEEAHHDVEESTSESAVTVDYSDDDRYIPEPVEEVNELDLSNAFGDNPFDMPLKDDKSMESILGKTIRIDLPE